MAYKLLVVDDEIAMTELLQEFLEEQGYMVETAGSGEQALEILEKDPAFNLVLSDIMMPGIKGFELLRLVSQKYPRIKRMLITACNVDEYMELIKKYNIGNILTKTSPFNFDEVKTYVHNILTEEIFGLKRYLKPGIDVQSVEIIDPNIITEYSESIIERMNIDPRGNRLKLVIVELLTNAIFYGIKKCDGSNKGAWDYDFKLDPGQVEVQSAKDDEKYAFAVIDHGGTPAQKGYPILAAAADNP
ncbi:MAG: response regulator [bacterium]